MLDVLLTVLLVGAEEVHDVELVGLRLIELRVLSHHHAGQQVPRMGIQFPLHQDEGGLGGAEVVGELSRLRIPVLGVYERGGEELDQHGFSAAVLQGDQGALPV